MFDFQPRLEEGLSTLGLETSGEQINQLMCFADLLRKWNKVYNLTAIRRDDEIPDASSFGLCCSRAVGEVSWA